MDTGSFIANFNQFYGNKYQDPQWKTCLIIRDHVLFMSHHFIDVAGTIEIGVRPLLVDVILTFGVTVLLVKMTLQN